MEVIVDRPQDAIDGIAGPWPGAFVWPITGSIAGAALSLEYPTVLAEMKIPWGFSTGGGRYPLST
jgi:hypothetical protein